jgi:RNA polymerase sigma-70 factor (ECF subfamily)
MSHTLAIRARIPSQPMIRMSKADRGDDAALYERWLDGDVEGFTRLYEQHNPRLVVYSCKVVNDRAVAEDIVQRAWEKLIEARNRRMKLESPVGFLVRTVRNLAIDHLRHEKFTAPIGDAPEAIGTHESDREAIVLECLDELKDETREMLVLHYYSGYSFEEIATMMKMKPNAIYTRVSRARAELKRTVEQRLAALKKIGGER